jgi:hypothetical protein
VVTGAKMTIAKIFWVNLGQAVAAVDGNNDARCGAWTVWLPFHQIRVCRSMNMSFFSTSRSHHTATATPANAD